MIELAAQKPGGFDPASLLGSVVPLLLVLPLFAFAIIVSTFRTRRPSVNTAIVFTAAPLIAAAFCAVALRGRTSSYRAAYQWINIALSFTGPQQFQGFGIDIALLLDRVGSLAVLTVLVIVFLALTWSRARLRAEPGLVRFYAILCLALFATLGLLLSSDLAEALAFWGVLGTCTYLLLANRWGTPEAATTSRLGLALPFVGDLALLGAVALLYSRYGRGDFPAVFRTLHSTPGAGLKSLTAVAILIFVAAAIRSGLVPFLPWLSRTAWAAAPGVAVAQAVWPVVAGMLVYRTLPIFSAAGPQALDAMTITAITAALLAGLLALIAADLSRALTAAGTVHAALVFVALARGDGVLAVLALLAGATARSGGILAMATLHTAMRARQLGEMGEAFRRMRRTSAALLVAGIALPLSLVPVAANGFHNKLLEVAFAIALFLMTVAWLRAYARTAHAPLPRRRAFDPDRVTEGSGSSRLWPLLLSLLGVLGALAALFPGWTAFLGRRGSLPAGGVAVWVAVALVAAVAGVGLFARSRSAATWTDSLGLRVRTGGRLATRAYVPFGTAGYRIVDSAEGAGLGRAESEVGGGLTWPGAIATLLRARVALAALAVAGALGLVAAVAAGAGQ